MKKVAVAFGLVLALAAGMAQAQRYEVSFYGAWNSLAAGGNDYGISIFSLNYGYYFSQQLVGTIGIGQVDTRAGNQPSDYSNIEFGAKYYFGGPIRSGQFVPFVDGGVGLWDSRNSKDTSWRLGVGGSYFVTETTSVDPTFSYINIQSSPKTNGHIIGVRFTTRF